MCIYDKIIKKIINLIVYGHKASSKLYIAYLKKKGVKIGDGAVLFNSQTIDIDVNDPFMLSIGKNFQCTSGVTILTHDYAWSVTKAIYNDVLGSIRPTAIGDNVYIGTKATILPGVTIGDNVVIGANSLVSKDIESNSVAVGNPCKRIYSIEEYYKKRILAQQKEVLEIAKCYKKATNKKPTKNIFREHFWTFTNNLDDLNKYQLNQNSLIFGSKEKTNLNFVNHKPLYNSFDEMLEIAFEDNQC